MIVVSAVVVVSSAFDVLVVALVIGVLVALVMYVTIVVRDVIVVLVAIRVALPAPVPRSSLIHACAEVNASSASLSVSLLRNLHPRHHPKSLLARNPTHCLLHHHRLNP